MTDTDLQSHDRPETIKPSQQRPDPRTDMDAKLAAEIEEALGDMSLEDMLDIAEQPKQTGRDRERRTGTVMSVHGGDVFVEFGPKSQGVCPLAAFTAPPVLGERAEFI